VWELSKLGDEAPRLLRAAIRRLDVDPAEAVVRQQEQLAALMTVGRWVAGAIVVGSALVAGALLFS